MIHCFAMARSSLCTSMRAAAVLAAFAFTACGGDKRSDAAAGTITFNIGNGPPIWIRIDGSMCPALEVLTSAGDKVHTDPLGITCCNCGASVEVAVYRKVEAGARLAVMWDGREFFTVNTGDNCVPLRNETRPVKTGNYVATLRWLPAKPSGATCQIEANGDTRCWDECEPTSQKQVPFTLTAQDVVVPVDVPVL